MAMRPPPPPLPPHLHHPPPPFPSAGHLQEGIGALGQGVRRRRQLLLQRLGLQRPDHPGDHADAGARAAAEVQAELRGQAAAVERVLRRRGALRPAAHRLPRADEDEEGDRSAREGVLAVHRRDHHGGRLQGAAVVRRRREDGGGAHDLHRTREAHTPPPRHSLLSPRHSLHR